MLDKQEIDKLNTKAMQAYYALTEALDEPLSVEHNGKIGTTIVHHLLHVELGRDANWDEVDAVLEAMQRSLLIGDGESGQKGGAA